MLVSYKHRFIFIHVYKVAGTSIRAALEPYCEDKWKRRAARLLGRTGLYKPNLPDAHLKASEIREMLPAETYDPFFKFAFVRNPWDWQVSLYHYARNTSYHPQHEMTKSFADFNEYLRWRLKDGVQLQQTFVCDDDGNLIIDHVSHLETLNDDFPQICRTVGIPNIELPHINKSAHKSYQDYYSDETRDQVAQAYKKDIDLFGYCFDGIAKPGPITTRGNHALPIGEFPLP